METRIDRKNLVEALGRVVGIINPTPTIPALSHVLMEAGDDLLSLTGTDLEVTVRTRVANKPARKGKLLVPGKKLFDLAREAAESEITLKSDKETSLGLSQAGGVSASLVCLKAQDFPAISQTREPETFSLSAQALRRGITLTRPVVQVNENKPNISGIFVTTEEGWVTLVSTDTKRLSRYRTRHNLSRETGFTLPARAADMIRGAWEDAESIEVQKGTNQAVFRGRETEITCQLITAAFPDYQRVIPPAEKLVGVELPRKRLVAALRRVQLIVSAGRNVVSLEFAGGKLVVSGETSGLGEGREEIEIAYEGEQARIDFQPDFLLDGLKNLEESENVTFHLNRDLDRPSMMTGAGEGDYIYLVMPIKA